jgi:hypothetical protein
MCKIGKMVFGRIGSWFQPVFSEEDENLEQLPEEDFSDDWKFAFEKLTKQIAEQVPVYKIFCIVGYLHSPTDISENCVVQHLKVSHDKNRIDPICVNCVAQHNTLDCVNRP